MSNTIELRAQKGVRNDVSPERFDRDELGRRTGFTDLSAAVNLDLDETGKLMRRLGVTRLLTGNMHSLYAKGDQAYVVIDGVLTRLMPDMTTVPMAPVSGRVAMVRIVNFFYWTDGATSGMLAKGVNTPWGITVPPAFGSMQIPGDLLSGTYLFTMTYVRSTGEESGAVACGGITLGTTGGIGFPVLPVSNDPLVVSKRLYMTERNGELPLLAGTLPNATTSASITAMPSFGMPLRTQFMGPPPAGHVVGEFYGRSLVAVDNYLWYSQPYEYGLFDLKHGFVGFETPVRTMASVVDGVFLGTQDETFWLAGTNPKEWALQSRGSYGTVLGTEIQLLNYVTGNGNGAPGTVMGWMSQKGFCLGFDGGAMLNVTGGRHIPPAAREGASLLKIRGGTPQVVTTLFN